MRPRLGPAGRLPGRLVSRLGRCRRAGATRSGWKHAGSERGSAVVEFVFVAVAVMMPLVYLIVAVAVVQRSQLAVSQAAREVGRAFVTSPTAAESMPRADAALRLALADQGLPDDATVRFVAGGAGCDAPPVTPELSAGAEFTVCIIRHAALPAVPSVLAGRGVTTVGVYVVHVDDYRAGGP